MVHVSLPCGVHSLFVLYRLGARQGIVLIDLSLSYSPPGNVLRSTSNDIDLSPVLLAPQRASQTASAIVVQQVMGPDLA